MKLKVKLIILFVGLVVSFAQAAEYTKTIHAGYVTSQVTDLKVTNKFGTIEINDWGGDSVTVDVTITVESISENTANSLLDQIDIDITRTGGLVRAETDITDNFRTTQNFSVDYVVNIPKDRNLSINNRFGDLVLNELEGTGDFEIAYGNITAGTINSPEPTILDLSYGKADIETINQLSAEVSYSKVNIGNGETLNLDSKYSGLNFETLGSLDLESKYDEVSIELADNISAESKYTNYDIEKLSNSIVLDTEYGTVQIDEVNNGFQNIDISNNYGGISIGLNDVSYYLDAECDYCDINYDEDSFQGNRTKNNNNLEVEGTIGNNSANKQVKVSSRFGNIKLSN